MRGNTRLPAIRSLGAVCLAVFVTATPGKSQDAAITTAARFRATAGGRELGVVRSGARVRVVRVVGVSTLVTISGFVERAALGPARDSFPATVIRSGTELRAAGNASSAIVADLGAGMGLARVADHGTWTEVSRNGWVASNTVGKVQSAPAPAPPTAVKTTAPPSPAAPLPAGAITPMRASGIRNSPQGPAFGTVIPGAVMTPLSRERGWIRVRVEGWVNERDVEAADSTLRGAISAADLRADPQGFRGRTIRWDVEILALQTADALRKEMAEDEPYLLARGPTGENALLYLTVPSSLLATARSLPPLTRVSIVARVRSAHSEPIGVPILDLQAIVKR